MITTRSFYRMYTEQYSSRAGTATLSIPEDKSKVIWSLTVGGVERTGQVPIFDSVEASLYAARKDVDALAATEDVVRRTIRFEEDQPEAPDVQGIDLNDIVPVKPAGTPKAETDKV
jgi:hypothetical protein